MPPPYCYDYPRPAVTVDLAVFALDGNGLRVLMIRRKHDPFAGLWALPGGFLEIDEAVQDGARRELREETGFAATGPISFLGAYGEPGRDPRGRTISLAHAAVLRGVPPKVQGGDDARDAAWRPARDSGRLAFDHDLMLADALAWLASGVRVGPLGLGLLPEEFDEERVQAMFRAIFGPSKGSGPWLRRMLGEGRIGPVDGPDRRYRVAGPGPTA
jgi:8-oxo-dGTP diphosphatase